MTNMGQMSTDAWASVQLTQHHDMAAERRADAARQRLAATAGEPGIQHVGPAAARALDRVTGRATHVAATAMDHRQIDRSNGRVERGGSCADSPATGQAA